MPRGDGTGPMGMGPMTGRGAAIAAAEASGICVAAQDSALAEDAEAVEWARPAEHVLRHRPDRLAASRNERHSTIGRNRCATAEAEKQFLETQVERCRRNLTKLRSDWRNLQAEKTGTENVRGSVPQG